MEYREGRNWVESAKRWTKSNRRKANGWRQAVEPTRKAYAFHEFPERDFRW